MTKTVLVLGGYGTCGRRIAEILNHDPEIECLIGGRDVRRGQIAAAALGVPFLAVDTQRVGSLNAALDGVFAVVNTCGPFRVHDYAVAERCARRGVYYVDMAEERPYILGIQDLAPRALESGVTLVSGAGSALAFSSMLVDTIMDAFDTVEHIDIAVLSGNRNPRGLASVRSLLQAQGEQVRVCEHEQWRDVPNFSRGRAVRLPAPFGRRRLYITDAPETDILGKRYGASVTYRTGLELPLLNRGHAWLGALSRLGVIGDLTRLAGMLHMLQTGLRGFGQAAFGITIVIKGQRKGQPVVRKAGLMAREDGLSVSCIPAIALVRKWVTAGGTPGAFPCDGLLMLQDIAQELRMRHVVLQLS
ncbi:MAG TPA: saccharopine dehydrogenase NADP-binding domain-containing protein [Acidiferrobacter sp.]|nr:saccharopine dehydrogenase NADP-binding domain-containing protein [Acidiferrobacter sp.]